MFASYILHIAHSLPVLLAPTLHTEKTTSSFFLLNVNLF